MSQQPGRPVSILSQKSVPLPAHLVYLPFLASTPLKRCRPHPRSVRRPLASRRPADPLLVVLRLHKWEAQLACVESGNRPAGRPEDPAGASASEPAIGAGRQPLGHWTDWCPPCPGGAADLCPPRKKCPRQTFSALTCIAAEGADHGRSVQQPALRPLRPPSAPYHFLDPQSLRNQRPRRPRAI